MIELFIFAIGLVIGSFIGALTYRLPKGIKISKGRSFCPKCHHQISWYDNIPLLSYLALAGKCRNCRKSISLRYPLIEFTTALVFVVLYVFKATIFQNIPWLNGLGLAAFPLLYTTVVILLTLAIIDIEYQILPDELIFSAIFLILGSYVFFDIQNLFACLFAGLVSAVFLLGLYFVTMRRGMGLGDVKLALLLGLLIGPALSLFWLIDSFIIGGVVGIALLLTKNAKLKDRIAFGPFLICGFFVVALAGAWMQKYFTW